MERAAERRQRCVVTADLHALPCGRRAYRNVAGVAAEAASELRIADVDEAACGRHAGEVRDPLGLRVTVVHQPRLALERRGGVGVQRLVAVKQDVSLEMQELERGKRHTRE